MSKLCFCYLFHCGPDVLFEHLKKEPFYGTFPGFRGFPITICDSCRQTMSSGQFSFLLNCSFQSQSDTMQLQVVEVDSHEMVRFKDGKFLLRITVDSDGAFIRCMLRHLASGREANIQSGLNLGTFIKDCLLRESDQL